MPHYDWSDEVRGLLQVARDEAIAHRHEYVGPEHLLLALARTSHPTRSTILQQLAIEPTAIRTMVESVVLPGTGDGLVPGDLPFTTRSKVVLEQAMKVAATRKETTIDVPHLLLGLLREGGSIAAQVLDQSGVTPERITAMMDTSG